MGNSLITPRKPARNVLDTYFKFDVQLRAGRCFACGRTGCTERPLQRPIRMHHCCYTAACLDPSCNQLPQAATKTLDRGGSPVTSWCGPSKHPRVTSSSGTCKSKMEMACAIHGISSQRKIYSIWSVFGEGPWQKDRKAKILISAWQTNFSFADQST